MRLPAMFRSLCWLGLGGGAAVLPAQALSMTADSQDDAASTAAAAIAEYRVLCERDHARLWGQSLCGPIMLVERDTRALFVDREVPGQGLQRRHGVFVGQLPADIGIANTATEWAGLRWTMLQLPLPQERQARAELLMHEAFHRIQPERLPAPVAPLPEHLDQFDGRVGLRLEWRALAQALRSSGAQRQAAIADALAFRAWRRQRFEDAAVRENALEINEGLAEYTGRRLGDAGDPAVSAIATLEDYDHRRGYVRSFAYASGPAYGLLLDALAPGWRRGLRPDSDLGTLLRHAAGDPPLPDPAVAGQRYGEEAIRREETTIREAHDQQAAQWRAQLVDGPLLRLALVHMNIEFDPRTVFPLPPHGTVYPHAIIRDDWGTLTVERGVLLAGDWKTATVAGPASAVDGRYQGAGWTLALAVGWELADGVVRRRSETERQAPAPPSR